MRTHPAIIFLIFIASLTILPAMAFCQSSPQPVCAVLTFHPDEASAQDYESRYITARYSELLDDLERYEVLSPGEIEKRLTQAKKSNLSAACSKKQCALDIGKAVNADFVIFGIIGHIGNMYSLDTTIVNVETGDTLNSTVTDMEGSRDEFVEQAPPENITSLLMLSQIPSEWRTTPQSPTAMTTEPAPAEKVTETDVEMEKPFHIGPRLGLGYSDDGVEVGIGFEARYKKFALKAIGGPIGIAGAFAYYFKPVGNTPYVSLVTAYYEDDPHGVDENGMLYGGLAGYRINFKENIDLCLGIGVGYVDWEQTEENDDGDKDSGADTILIGEFTIGYMF